MDIDKTPLSNFFARPRKNWKPLTKVQQAGVRTFRQMVENGEFEYEKIACPCCNTLEHRLLGEVDKYGLNQNVVICKSCGFVFNNPRLTEESYARLYDTVYRQIYMGYEIPGENYFEEQYSLRGVRYAEHIQKHLPYDYRGKLVLEIGCGAGGILQRFEELGADVLGFDYDSRYIEYGKQNHNLELVTGNYRDFVFSRKPDVVILAHVLEHFLDYKTELEALKNIMSEDAILFVEVPWLLGRRFGWTLQLAHVSYFTESTLLHSLEGAGFEVPHFDHFNTHINCIAKKASSPPIPRALDKEYETVLSALQTKERLEGNWNYYKYQRYYPLIRPLELLDRARRNPQQAVRKLQKLLPGK